MKTILRLCTTLLLFGCVTTRNAPVPAGYEEAVATFGTASLQDLRSGRMTIRGVAKDLEAIVEKAPSFAPAAALLAEARLIDDLQSRERRGEARRLAERALALSPDEPRAHAVMGWLRFVEDYRYAEARAAFERALAGEPGDAFARYGYGLLLASQGELDRGLGEVERAERETAIRPNWRMGSQAVLFFSRRYREAAERAAKPLNARADSEPDLFWLGAARLALGDLEGAIAALEERAGQSNRAPGAVAKLAIAYATAGRAAEARALLPELRSHLDRVEKTGNRPCSANPCYLFALVDAALGDQTGALEMLARAVDDRPPGIWNVWLKVDPRMDPLRSHPSFAGILRKSGFGG